MGRRPFIPVELTQRPFTLEEARRAGLTDRQLESRCWRRVGPGTYAWIGLGDGPELRLAAVHRRLPPGAVFAGRTAGWLHGLDMAPCDPVELIVPPDCGVTARVGVALRRARLDTADVTVCRGLPATSPGRTLHDLANTLPLAEAVVAVDSALRLGLIDLDGLQTWVERRARAKGVKRLRRVLDLAEAGTESPMESRLRLLLVQAGLPRPLVQVDVHDRTGRFLGRVDLYYPPQRLAIEYDGGTHRESLLEDNRRQNRLLAAGYRLLRFAAGDVMRAPDSVVAEVRSALLRAA